MQWQSEPGWYEALVIDEGGERPLITVYQREVRFQK
jgi:hypothetical protein